MLSTGFRKLARDLIAARTVSAMGTRQAADLLQELWEHAGLAVRRQVVDEIHVNLLGGPGGQTEGAGGVLLVTHLDTVPPGPLERWTETGGDPWSLTEKDGWLFGLGAADVKLDALCKAEAARRLQGRKLRRPFWLLGTYGEEVGLRGARHFAGSALFAEVAPSQVLCGEPSELQIIHAHKGYAVVRCTVRDRRARLVSSAGPGVEQLHFAGKAAHSSTPHLGVNAILRALAWAKSSATPVLSARGGSSSNVVPATCVLEVPGPREKGEPNPDEAKFLPARGLQPNLWRALATASALEELWQQLLPKDSDARFDPAGAVGGLNVLSSAEPAAAAPDAVYGTGEISLQLDARLLPDHDPDQLIERFTARARDWVEQLGRGELELEVATERNAGGMALPEGSPLVKAAGAVLARHGLDPRPRAKPTSTEAGVFARAGCEAIVFGPGRSTGNAHTPNERIEMAQLEKACDLYQSLLLELCPCT
jgi:acetylornithine deacetylase/succinyl-diaminopimelate desuccinylase-like protein